MASSNNSSHSSFPAAFHFSVPNSAPDTTFVQADPSSFRAVVQCLTGAGSTSPMRTAEAGHWRPTFKLHERRPTAARKLEIKAAMAMRRSVESAVMFSPVSPLEYLAAATARGSPKSPMEQEEERAIAEKGFYLHPDPLSTPRGSDPPELLPLFPLYSPRDN